MRLSREVISVTRMRNANVAISDKCVSQIQECIALKNQMWGPHDPRLDWTPSEIVHRAVDEWLTVLKARAACLKQQPSETSGESPANHKGVPR